MAVQKGTTGFGSPAKRLWANEPGFAAAPDLAGKTRRRLAGVVLGADRPDRLAFTFDDPDRVDDPTFEPSLVDFEIEDGHRIVKLTLTPDPTAEQGGAGGHR